MSCILAFCGVKPGPAMTSLRSWRDFARECFCFRSKAVNASGKAVRGLVKSRVEFHSRGNGGSTAARPLTNPASYAG